MYTMRYGSSTERVEYKVCLLVFKALHGMAPNYLSELCRPNAEDTARSIVVKFELYELYFWLELYEL